MHFHVLVEGAGAGDLTFVVRWLLSVAKADRMLGREFEKHPKFRTSIERLEVVCLLEFRPPALAFLRMFFDDLTTFSLDLKRSEWADMFVIMTAAGFFELTGDRYQMTVPKKLEMKKIKRALLQLAATEDKDYELHPERFVRTIAYSELTEWRKRLDRLSWQQRLTDRAILLGSF